eukprot:9278243-Ditylum_brightwellii.AAC.1
MADAIVKTGSCAMFTVVDNWVPARRVKKQEDSTCGIPGTCSYNLVERMWGYAYSSRTNVISLTVVHRLSVQLWPAIA